MSRTRNSESGFTLAGLIVLMTVIGIVIAYTVPAQWSLAVARDRDQQTIFAMKQYARALRAFQEKNKAQPVSLDQLKEARTPRFMRGTKGELVDPLTGKIDWIPIPLTNQQAQPGQAPGVVPNVPGVTPNQRTQIVPTMPMPGQPANASPGQPGGFVGPIMGVRPNKTGKSYVILNGQEDYEQWSYTTVDLENEIASHRNSIMVK